MKKYLFSTAILSFMVIGGTLVANAEDTKDTSSKVTGKAKAGIMKIEAEDIDFGKLEIGGDIKTPSKKDGVMILDNSGGEGWQATVKNTSYENNKNTLAVKFNNTSLIGTEQEFSTGESLRDKQFRDINATAEWGSAPESGNYQSDLVWTLKPNIDEYSMVWGTAKAKLDGDGILTVKNGILSDSGDITDGKSSYFDGDVVKRIVIEENVSIPSESWGVFSGFSNLEGIDGLDKLDSSKATKMGGMFSNTKIDGIDFSKLDTTSLVDMESMFMYTSGASVDLNSIDTSKVTNMDSIFNRTSVESINISNWNTSKVTNFYSSFMGIDFKEIDLDLSNLDISSARALQATFGFTSNLEQANIYNWDTSQVDDFSSTFVEASTIGNVLSEWNFSNAKKINGLFFRTRLDLKVNKVHEMNFTDKLETVDGMFSETYFDDYTIPLDLSNVIMTNVTSANGMFTRSRIERVEVSDWRFNSENMGTNDISEIESKVFKDYKGTHSDTSHWLD